MYETPEPGSEWEATILSVPEPFRTWVWEMDKCYSSDPVLVLHIAKQRWMGRTNRQDAEEYYKTEVHPRCVKFWEKIPRVKIEKEHTEAEPRWYFGTFTQPDTEVAPHQILSNTAKLIKSKMVEPIEWCYSLELTKQGIPHTHYAFLTHKYPEYKKIHKFNCSKLKILWRSMTEPARNASHAIRYVQKTETKPSDVWLVEHGITQTLWLSDKCPLVEPDTPMSPGAPQSNYFL